MARRYEPEHTEPVDHDTVMVMKNGKLVELTADHLIEVDPPAEVKKNDPEIQQ